MATITVRQATAADSEAVLGLNTDVYDGFDYMPALYHKLLQDKLSIMFVAEQDGKIVSNMHFLVFQIVISYTRGGCFILLCLP